MFVLICALFMVFGFVLMNVVNFLSELLVSSNKSCCHLPVLNDLGGCCMVNEIVIRI